MRTDHKWIAVGEFDLMLAIKKVRKLIQTNPASTASQTLAGLVLALENRTPFALESLYSLNGKAFDLALEVLSEWRLDRHYASKLRLLDLSTQVQELGQTAHSTPKSPQAAG